MATAKRPGGLYYTATGAAVDANGVLVADAPERVEDTDPSKQPGSLHVLARTPEERVGLAIARAMVDPKGVLKAEDDAVKAAKEAKDEKDKLAPAAPVGTSTPTITRDPATMTVVELAAYLATLTTAEQVAGGQKADKRKGVYAALYDARLEEIEANTPAEDPKSKKSKGK